MNSPQRAQRFWAIKGHYVLVKVTGFYATFADAPAELDVRVARYYTIMLIQMLSTKNNVESKQMKIRNYIYSLFIASCLIRTCIAGEEKIFDYKTAELSNGLRIVTLEDNKCPVVAVQLWYHVGSKDEDPKRQGFAHMFEHMMFQGTDRLGPTGHFDNIHRVGGNCNAYTNFDETVYIETVPSNQLELALYLEAERMTFLKVDQKSFDTEWSPIGKIPHLRAAAVQELRDFWTRYYIPNNATLVIVGAVKHDQAVSLAKKYFEWIPRQVEPPRITVKEPEQTAARAVTIKANSAPAPLVGILYHTMPQGQEDFLRIEVLSKILCEGSSSRIYRALVADNQLAAYAQGFAFSLEQDGLFAVGAALQPFGGDTGKALKAIQEEIDKIRADHCRGKAIGNLSANAEHPRIDLNAFS